MVENVCFQVFRVVATQRLALLAGGRDADSAREQKNSKPENARKFRKIPSAQSVHALLAHS